MSAGVLRGIGSLSAGVAVLVSAIRFGNTLRNQPEQPARHKAQDSAWLFALPGGEHLF